MSKLIAWITNADATVVVALITAIAAIFAPTISSIITGHIAYKTHRFDKFYTSQIEAISNFFKIAEQYYCGNPNVAIADVVSAAEITMLYVSLESKQLLQKYCNAITHYREFPCPAHQPSATLRTELLASLQHDIQQSQSKK